MQIQVENVRLRAVDLSTRFPFRYGIATLTHVPYVIVAADVAVDGRTQRGLAADILPPKWFTKYPELAIEDEISEMAYVIRQACILAEELPPASSVFDFWHSLDAEQRRWGDEQRLPPLLTGFGTSLVERAVIDAFCRASGTPFARAVHENTFGIRLDALHKDLKGQSPHDLLPHPPQEALHLRHTVGLGDALTDVSIPHGDRVDDGLPQSLEANIRHYGLNYFKIKVPADIDAARQRLRGIARVVQANCSSYGLTLDGNEFFKEIDAFHELWSAISADHVIGSFLEAGLLAVEQPLHRDVALSEEAARSLHNWPDRPPIIIDESDGAIDSLPRALACGYAGTSHKNCKGVFHGIASACLLAQQRRENPGGARVLTGEDLMNVGPVALLQDLAVASVLGIEHIERNGHHYVRGLSTFPEDVQEAVLAQHGDLYERCVHNGEEFATLRVKDGLIQTQSVLQAPFGYGISLDADQFPPFSD